MNNKQSKENFFEEFKQVDKKGWVEMVLEELKQSDLNQLVSHAYENVAIQPFYTKEDNAAFPYLQAYQHNFANVDNPAFPTRFWTNYELLDASNTVEANKLALQALNAGAEGIVFDLNESNSMDTQHLFTNIQLPYCHISFTSSVRDYESISKYFAYVKKSFPDAYDQITGFYGFDILSNWTKGQGPKELDFTQLVELVKKANEFPGFKPIAIQGHQYHENGANAIQEIAFVLNEVVELIDRLSESNVELEDILNNLYVSLSVGSDIFMEMAKLRAFRILFDQMVKVYGITNYHPGDLHIHCTTSKWTKSVLDQETNILRNTTEAMAAVLGGCNSLHISPHDALTAQPSSFSRRIARNISNILREEAYIDKVVDPAAGSYYLENLTGEIVQKSWDLFKMIEDKGGFIQAFKQNIIQEEINKVKHKKYLNISKQKTIIVGTNQYPNLSEKINTPSLENDEDTNNQLESFEYLQPGRASEEIEKLRLKTQKIIRDNSDIPLITIVNLGKDKIQKIRHNFVQTFFNVAGFETSSLDIHQQADEAIEGLSNLQSRVVTICGNDESYLEHAVGMVKLIKTKLPDKLVFMAGKLDKIAGQLTDAGLDGHIFLYCDLVNTIESIHEFLLSSKRKEVNSK